ALLKERFGLRLKIFVKQEGNVPRSFVQFDNFRLLNVTEQPHCAAHTNTQEQRHEFQQAFVQIKRLFILPAHLQFFTGELDFVSGSGRLKQFETLGHGHRVIREGGSDIQVQAAREVLEPNSFVEVRQGQINKQVIG